MQFLVLLLLSLLLLELLVALHTVLKLAVLYSELVQLLRMSVYYSIQIVDLTQ